jgi:hypothetical protein
VDHPQAGHLNRLNHPSQGRQPETRIIVIIWSRPSSNNNSHNNHLTDEFSSHSSSVTDPRGPPPTRFRCNIRWIHDLIVFEHLNRASTRTGGTFNIHTSTIRRFDFRQPPDPDFGLLKRRNFRKGSSANESGIPFHIHAQIDASLKSTNTPTCTGSCQHSARSS